MSTRYRESHVGVHWCDLDPYECLGRQYREQKPRLIAAIRANIAYYQSAIRAERKRLCAAGEEEQA